MNIHKIYEKETVLKPNSGSIDSGDFAFTDNYVEWLEKKLVIAFENANESIAVHEALSILALKANMSGEDLEELISLCKLPLSERFKKMGIKKVNEQ